MARVSCSNCTPDRRGNHQPGCPSIGGSPFGGKKDDVPVIAAHGSEWSKGGEVTDSNGKKVVSWTCTVCGRSGGVTEGPKPGGQWHERTDRPRRRK